MTISERALQAASKWGLPVKEAAEEPTGRDRREAERAVAYWEEKVEALGEATIAVLDLAAIDDEDWANRFLIAIDEKVERSVLLMYGAQFARLLGLPPKPQTHLPLERQLPPRFAEIFMQACRETPLRDEPLRLEGEIERDAGRVEQYRAVFIPVKVRPGSRTHFAFGAFNGRIVEPALAA
ncbi:MAG: hypothetical protein ACM3JG_16185 [Thiohalocapsa sp.]